MWGGCRLLSIGSSWLGIMFFGIIGCLTMRSFTPQPAGDVTAFVISAAITHMAAVKALRATCTPLSPRHHSPFHSQRPTLCLLLSQLSPRLLPHSIFPAHPPHLALSPSFFYFPAIFCSLCPPTSPSPVLSLSLFFIIPPYSLIIFPDKLHSWTTPGLYSQALPIIFCPFKTRLFSAECARHGRLNFLQL